MYNAPQLHIAQICRETGKEYMVQVHSGEGLANHPGPEPCGGLREGADEKSVGGHVGRGFKRAGKCERRPTSTRVSAHATIDRVLSIEVIFITSFRSAIDDQCNRYGNGL